MKFFDKILKAIGFENVEEENDEKKPAKREKITSSKFDLRNKNSKKIEDSKEEIEIFAPKSQSDIENIANRLINGENLLIYLSNFSEVDKTRTLEFLSGVVFVLKIKLKKIDNNLYLISKNDGEIVE